MMNRSFICGIVVASTTWCFSLYMYWVLTKTSSELSPNNIQWSPSHDSHQYVVLKQNSAPNMLNQLDVDDEKQHRAQEQKDTLFKKYKKEQKFRKISQRLKDELKPVEVNGGPGIKLLQLHCIKNDFINFFSNFR